MDVFDSLTTRLTFCISAATLLHRSNSHSILCLCRFKFLQRNFRRV